MSDENKEIQIEIPLKEEVTTLAIFENTKDFEIGQRMAQALSQSTIVPKEYQGKLSNVLIALDMSNRMGVSPMMVMQNLYVINGRPSWSSQFIVATINNSKRFAKPLRFNLSGVGVDMECYCYTEDYDGTEVKGPTITMAMAKAEGWTTKNLSKWKTMPEVMIRYRSASFFGRLYCPDILMGVYSEDENQDTHGKAEEDTIPVSFIEIDNEIKENTEKIKEKLSKENEELDAEILKSGELFGDDK